MLRLRSFARSFALLALCVPLILPLPLAAAAQTAPRLESFSPQGLAKGVRQVVARFSAPVVAFGDPRPAPDAFEVSCAAKGRARWATVNEWVYDFEADLPAGLRCAFTLKPGLKTVRGALIGGRRTFAFDTGGPAVRQVVPYARAGIAEDQRFVLRLDAVPDPGTVEKHARLEPAGALAPIPVRIVTGAEREAVLKRALWEEPEPTDLVIEPVLQLPSGQRVALVWGAGIATNGVATREPQVFPFDVRGPLSLTIHCDRLSSQAGCTPIMPVSVRFSEPVSVKAATQARLVPLGDAPSARAVPLVRPEESERSEFGELYVAKGPFAPSSRYRLELPPDVRDDSGRALAPFDPERLTLQMDALPPLAKFSARFGVLEAADPVLPVAIRNLEASALPKGASVSLGGSAAAIARPNAAQIWGWLRASASDRSAGAPGTTSIFELAGREMLGGEAPKPLALPRLAGKDEAEVVGIPLPGLGLHAVEIESRVLGAALLGPEQTHHAASLALVTNLSVHLKLGREGSLVWVTTLDRAAPVEGARVAVFDCQAKQLASAVTDASGIARVAGLPAPEELDRNQDCGWRPYERGLLATAQQGADVSFVHTSWDEGLEPWRFEVPVGWRAPGPIEHTLLDRALFRAGETVHMKHLLRAPALSGLVVPEAAERPTELRIQHLGSGDEYALPLAFAADGSATSEWEIPKTAKLGSYQVSMSTDEYGEASGAFRVEEFRLPLMRGKLQGPQRPAIAGQPIPLDIALTYLSGGPAAALPVELRTQVRPHQLGEIAGFEQHAFLRGDVKTGVERREGWWWDESGGASAAAAAATPPAQQLSLDAAGGARAEIAPPPESAIPQQVVAELSFRDPNGELQTIAQTIPVFPGERLLGLRVGKHLSQGQPLHVDVALLDLERRPVRGAVRVDLYQRKVYSYRKRLVGGFYAYEHAAETTKLATLCEGRTSRAGTFACVAPLPATGQLIVRASASDGAGRSLATHEEIWAPGPDDYWYEASDSDRMDLVPEQRQVEPGETARIQVRVPFRASTALVTVEREGVAEAFVTRLSGRDPHVRLKIAAAHAPNVFVSVLAVRGRVAAPAPTAFVDLARPASKLGVTELRVGLAPRTLEVSVTPEREAYRVRETVRARIRVRTPEGKLPPPGSEVALAVVDEALLELAPNASWNLLEAMHGRRSYDVRTFTAQQQVVGKRHFGLKARPTGGGGGASATRELFATLLVWRPRVALDAKGEASVEFALNDSLTQFRVAAIASGGADRFGTGFGKLRTTQDVMVLPGVAPVAREGDRVRPEFTVRNASEKPRELEVALSVEGLTQTFPNERLTLEPGEARVVAWEATIPAGVDSLVWNATASRPRSGEGAKPATPAAYDAVKTVQRVVPAVPERIVQAELVQLGAAPFVRAVEMPGDAVRGRGGVDVSLRPTLGGGTAGIDRFFREYRYACLEQQASSAIGRRDVESWRGVMAALPSYLDEDGLAKFWPSSALRGSDTLTAYLLSIAHEAGWEIPAESRDRMLAGLEGFVAGRVDRTRSWAPFVDLSLRRLAALEALSRFGRVAPEQLASLPAQPELWPTSALLDYLSLLGRVPDAQGLAAKRASAERLLRARLTVGGTTTGFSTEKADLMDWMLATAETNVNRFLLLSHGSAAFERDLPRLMKGALARQREGSWGTTVANAWGRLALERFSARFEKAPVSGATSLALGAEERRVAWAKSAPQPLVRLAWPAGRAELRAVHAGGGRPWAEIQSVAAIPLKQPLFAGYQVERSWAPVVQKTPGTWTRGDVVRVQLRVDAQSDFSWVVVDDPIPAGATILGSGLGRDSSLLTQGERSEGGGWWCPCRAFTERTQLAYRDYFEYVPKGKLELEYTLRLNQDGEFSLPPTRVEAMYAPESFGELPHAPLRVAP